MQFADGNQVAAEIVGFDPNADVGVVKVDPKGLELVPLELGPHGDVRVGEPVAAIGSPFGEQGSLSVGVVSATNRTIEALTDFSISDAIQTDAAINRGNSGGPLLDARGRVIGINSQIRSSGGGSEGVGFAVSVRHRAALDRADPRRRQGELRLHRDQLPAPLPAARRAARTCRSTRARWSPRSSKDGPADKAGIKGGGKEIRFQATLVKLGGDVITKVNGRRVTRENDFSELITRFQPGRHESRSRSTGATSGAPPRVTLGERPDQVPSG